MAEKPFQKITNSRNFHEGYLTAQAKAAGAYDEASGTINKAWIAKMARKGNTHIARAARLAQTFAKAKH